MVGGLLPAPHLTQDLGALQAWLQSRGGPNVIEAAAAIILLPIRRAIAPPGKDLLRLRHEMPDRILPMAGLLHRRQLFHLDRGMADDLEELLMGPDVIFQRRDIEIAHHDRLAGLFLAA